MAEGIRDENRVVVAMGVSSSDSTVTLPFKVNPATGRLLTDVSGGGSGDFKADGSVPMTADFNADGNNLDNVGVIFMLEQAAADADVAGSGQLWVKNTTPNELWFTDDAGTDVQLGVAGGGDALVANPLSQFAATTSAQLAGVMSDETGSGALVFATSPTLVTPALGTPSALVGTNITGTAAGLTVGATTGVEAGADVTDATNVAAAGAVMADGSVAMTSNLDLNSQYLQNIGRLELNSEAVTVSTGIVTAADSVISVSSESGFADNFDGITAGTWQEAALLYIYNAAGHTITLKNNQSVGGNYNFLTSNGGDIVLRTNIPYVFQLKGTSFVQVSPALVNADLYFRISDDGDATKQIAFQASGISTATTRTITMPDANVDLGDVGVAASETVAGVIELATDAEMTTGTATDRAITPANAKVELDKKLPLAGGTMTGAIVTTTLEIGHATDTTLARDAAGEISVEGIRIKTTTPKLVSAASYTTDTGTSLNMDNCDQFIITAQAGALLFNAPGGTLVQGRHLVIRIKDNGTARALTWNAVFRAMGTALPTTTVLSKTLYLGFFYNSTDTKWDLVASAQEA